MASRDDETFCYAAGFIALCTGTRTVRGTASLLPHCRNPTKEIQLSTQIKTLGYSKLCWEEILVSLSKGGAQKTKY
jgi:hypothetical protein